MERNKQNQVAEIKRELLQIVNKCKKKELEVKKDKKFRFFINNNTR